MKHFKKYTAVILTAMLMSGCAAFAETGNDHTAAAEDSDTSWSSDDVTITFSDNTVTASGAGVSYKDSTAEITKEGTYVISGSGNGTIVVNSKGSGTVHLVLNNVQLTSSKGPVIYISQADKTIVTSSEGTSNSITSDNENEDGRAGGIYAKDDLVINGSGTLSVTSDQDGIHANDTLVITGADLDITACDDGIQVHDALQISDSDIEIQSEDDGIRGGDDEDSAGTISIESSSLSVSAGDDGIDTPGTVDLSKVTLAIESGGGSDNAAEKNDRSGAWMEWSSSVEETAKAKGISADGTVTFNGGTYSIDSADDAVNSADAVEINEGVIDISSGDDGIHADQRLTINDGTITINKSYEGLESEVVELNGGTISVTSSDDGINASSGSSSENMFTDDGSTITVNGGDITVDADGDGIDSNGSVEINDGTIIVYGPSDNMNGALDCNGTFSYNGGSLMAGGSAGMAVYPSDSSSGYTIAVGVRDASKPVTLQDSDGSVIAEYSSTKDYAVVSFSCESIEKGETYTVVQDGEEIGTVTVVDHTSYINVSQSQGVFQPGGERPSEKGQRGI